MRTLQFWPTSVPNGGELANGPVISSSAPPEDYRDARILIVDDEAPNVLLLERMLSRAGFAHLTSTTDSRLVREMVEESSPDLILLDLHMPDVDGFGVLEALRPLLEVEYLPVLVLTADATRRVMERALSGGAKDFLTKPFDSTEVLLRIRNLLETRFLHRRERVLLEQTLEGSIRALVDVLSIVNPAGFSRALRTRDAVGTLLAHMGIESQWELEIAAMLSQIGSVVLPPAVVERHYYGKTLTHSDTVAVNGMAKVASRLVDGIPRMDGVARILMDQDRRFDGKGAPADRPHGTDLPWGARILKVLLDLDILETRGLPPESAMEMVRSRTGWYDPEIVELVAEMREIEMNRRRIVEMDVKELRRGMVLAEDIRTTTDMLLVARGQTVTEKLLDRLRNSQELLDRRLRVHVFLSEMQEGDEPIIE
jgi:response regulator RpfG family c-di-GMP phosphodiesterase